MVNFGLLTVVGPFPLKIAPSHGYIDLKHALAGREEISSKGRSHLHYNCTVPYSEQQNTHWQLTVAPADASGGLA